MLVRTLFVINLILGIAFWTGHESGGVKLLHMGIGILFVAALWAIGVLYAFRTGSFGLQLGTFLLGLVIALFGLFQEQLLVGSAHVVIQIIHLLLALLGMGLAEMIGGRVKKAAAVKPA
jgi:hypothetical protein